MSAPVVKVLPSRLIADADAVTFSILVSALVQGLFGYVAWAKGVGGELVGNVFVLSLD